MRMQRPLEVLAKLSIGAKECDHAFPAIPGFVIRIGSRISFRRFADIIFFRDAISRTVFPVLYDSFAIAAAASYPISGASAVHIARLFSIVSWQRSSLAWIPETQRSVRFSAHAASRRMESSILC